MIACAATVAQAAGRDLGHTGGTLAELESIPGFSAELPLGAHTETVVASSGGTMGGIDAMTMGLAAWRLGAGRARQGETVQPGAGIRIHRRPGDPVTAGDVLFIDRVLR